MWRTWFIRRFPARDSRWRICSPEEASRGAVPVQDANRLRSANRAMSPTSARIRAAPAGPTPWISIRVEPRAATAAFSSALIFFSFVSTATRSASSSAAIRRRVFPAMSRGRTVASIALACRAERSFLRWPGISSLSSRCSRLTVCTRSRASSSRRSVSIRSASSSPSGVSTRRPGVRSATIAIECASRASVLRLWPVSKSRTRAASFAGTSTTRSPASTRRWASGRPAPLAPSTAQIRSGQAFT